jgi:hypothetical protein
VVKRILVGRVSEIKRCPVNEIVYKITLTYDYIRDIVV